MSTVCLSESDGMIAHVDVHVLSQKAKNNQEQTI